MYYGGEKPSISQFFKCFSFGLDQALLSKKITSMLKINAIRQWIAFLSKLGVIFSFYIVSFKFPGIPRLISGNSRSREWNFFGKLPTLISTEMKEWAIVFLIKPIFDGHSSSIITLRIRNELVPQSLQCLLMKLGLVAQSSIIHPHRFS